MVQSMLRFSDAYVGVATLENREVVDDGVL
jgi:hypothetical protein